MRSIEVPLVEILGIINNARDDVLPMVFGELAKSVTDAEIKEYADHFLSPVMQQQGYTEVDRDSAVKKLTAWRNRYTPPEEKHATTTSRSVARLPHRARRLYRTRG